MNIQDNTRDYIYERAAFYYNYLLNSEECNHATDYLNQRHISLNTANNFMIGATLNPDNKQKRTNNMTIELSEYVNINDIISSKLSSAFVDKQNNTVSVYDFFGPGRIIIPIMDMNKPIYFTSRTTFQNKVPHKHLQSDSAIKNIFNQSVLCSKTREIYITEGIFDALSLAEINLPAIATLGTRGISTAHKELFTNAKHRYVFVFDNDQNEAGPKAVKRSASILKSFGATEIYEIKLPRKNGSSKSDVNQLLCQCIQSGRSKADFEKFFHGLKLHPISTETYQAPIQNTNYTRSNAAILNIASEYISDLQKISPTCYRAVCPFPDHQDSNPSFVIYTTTNTYKCFGCGKYGGPVKFLIDLLGISKDEAIQKVKAITKE